MESRLSVMERPSSRLFGGSNTLGASFNAPPKALRDVSTGVVLFEGQDPMEALQLVDVRVFRRCWPGQSVYVTCIPSWRQGMTHLRM